jgi:hypothetical protein
MNPLEWHKKIAKKVVDRIGLYTALWIAFLKGVLITLLIQYFL